MLNFRCNMFSNVGNKLRLTPRNPQCFPPSTPQITTLSNPWNAVTKFHQNPSPVDRRVCPCRGLVSARSVVTETSFLHSFTRLRQVPCSLHPSREGGGDLPPDPLPLPSVGSSLEECGGPLAPRTPTSAFDKLKLPFSLHMWQSCCSCPHVSLTRVFVPQTLVRETCVQSVRACSSECHQMSVLLSRLSKLSLLRSTSIWCPSDEQAWCGAQAPDFVRLAAQGFRGVLELGGWQIRGSSALRFASKRSS